MSGSNSSRSIEENDSNEVAADVSNRTLENGARKKIRHDSPPPLADNKSQSFRLAMVNNPKRSDIVFLVGRRSESEPSFAAVKIHAHTPILMLNSEVFDRMFSGDFEMANEIVVTDVEPDIFLQLMNFIYAGLSAVSLTTSNMIDLLYGAQKYMLHPLKNACEAFVLVNTNDSNLLDVYNASQLFENGVIKDMCSNIMLDNPLRFFNDNAFKELSAPAIKELMNHPKINCTEEQLRHFMLKWLRHKLPDEELTGAAAYEHFKAVAGVKAANFLEKPFINIKLDSFDRYTTARIHLNHTVCHPNRKHHGGIKFLHGIGVYTGVELFDTKECVTITLSESIGDKSWLLRKTMYILVKQQRKLSVVNIMFEKIKVQGLLLVTINFGSPQSRFCIKNTCKADHDHSKCHKFSCLAYMQYRNHQRIS